MSSNLQAQEETMKAIGEVVYTNRQKVINLLAKNGAMIPSDISDEDLLACVYASISNSAVFSNEFKQLVKSSYNENLNYVDENNTDYPEDFFNGDGDKYVGFLKDYFTPDVKKGLLDTGFKILTDKLESSVNKKEREQAIRATVAETARLQAETELKAKRALALQQKENNKKIIIPIVIISSIVVLGVVGLLVYKSMKKPAQ
jgi:hypothetical protein